jgi:MerR family copper efflux transcriptional regulator
MKEITQLVAPWQTSGRNSADVKALALAHAADLGMRIMDLQKMKSAIEKLAATCRGDQEPACPILDDLATGSSPLPSGTRARSMTR